MPKTRLEVGSHTLTKLQILEDYLKGYVDATKRARAFGVYYIDLFAGCGRVESRANGTVRNGSPLIALGLYPGFSGYFLVEANQENHDSLKEYIKEYGPELQTRVTLRCGDCNSVIDEVLTQLPPGKPTFAFLDPYAPKNLPWRTIRKLAKHSKPPKRKIELFILFPYDMGLARLLTSDSSIFDDRDYCQIFDSCMPPDSHWRDIYQTYLRGEIDRHELRRRFVRAYEDGLKSLGYDHVPESYLIRTNITTGQRKYFLVFASDHEAGQKIMTYCFRKPRQDVQMGLWPYSQRY